MLPAMQAGRNTAFGTVLESLANNYYIPSIDFGVEVARLEMAAELTMKSDLPVAGQIWFSMDGVRPGEAGHNLYTEIFARAFVKMDRFAEAKAHQLPEAINQRNWEKTALLPIAMAKLSNEWKVIDIQKDTIYSEGYKRTDRMLRGAVKCNKTGATINLKWKGTTLGFTDIPSANGCKIEITIDKAKPFIIERKQADKYNRAGLFYMPEQSFGVHTAVLKIVELPSCSAYYMGQILVVGTIYDH